MPAKRTPSGKASTTWMAGGKLGPVAVTAEKAAELLGIPIRDVRRLCRQIKPYVAADGTPRWSYRELSRALAATGRVVSPD